ncbi:MAG TPA: DUF4245 family protein [Nocardioides sp.]|nr:DUF4245 family protein [Nocardioides sp.]
MSTTEHTGRPGKYQRSAFGLVVAMITTVVAVVAALWFMGLFRHSTEYKPQKVDYLEAVAAAQQGKLAVVYPATLPDGYIATQARVPSDNDGFEIDLLKADSDFIGIRTARTANVAALVHQEIDANATSIASYDVPTTVAAPVARTWGGWNGPGNTGYSAQVGKLTVLVYGSAPAADLQQVVDLLSTAPRKLT